MSGATRAIVAMTHTAKGTPKLIPGCTLPLTSLRRVTLVVTDMAVVEPNEDRLVLRERAPGVAVDDIVAATGAELRIDGEPPEMPVQ